MPMARKSPPAPIVLEGMRDNETWNDCPRCGRTWKTEPPVPGLIHVTQVCNACKEKGRTFFHD